MSNTSEEIAQKESNNDRKIAAILKKAQKQHDWRVQVWAQCQLRINGMNAELEVLGHRPFEPFDPQFDDIEMVRHYAEMTLSK